MTHRSVIAASIQAIPGRPTPGASVWSTLARIMGPVSIDLTYRLREIDADQGAQLNPMEIAQRYATALTASEIKQLAEPLHKAASAAAAGHLTRDQWVILCSALNTARAIHDKGAARIAGIELDAVERILESIEVRGNAQQWAGDMHLTPDDLWEIQGLALALPAQLGQITYGDYTEAARLAKARALAHGGEVIQVNPD